MKDKTYKNVTLTRNEVNYLQYQIGDVSAVKNFFDIVSAKAIYDDYPDVRSTMHCHDFNVIIWFRESRGKHIVDFTEYDIDEDSIFFMSPADFRELD